MGGGYGKGLDFGHTWGSGRLPIDEVGSHELRGSVQRPAAGDSSLMSNKDLFALYISRRKDVDPNGCFDLIAHGSGNSIEIQHRGSTIRVGSRITAKMIGRLTGYHGQDIRLLSCNTGSLPKGFAQNLANKLGVTVWAPTDVLWAWPNGTYTVAARSAKDFNMPDLNHRGKFVPYYPGGNK